MHTSINNALDLLTAQIEESVAAAVTRGFERALNDAVSPDLAPTPSKTKTKTKPKTKTKTKTKPKTKPKTQAKPARRTAKAIAQHNKKIIEAIRQNPNSSAEDVRKLTGLHRAYVKSSLKQLCLEEKLSWTGQARGTRYTLTAKGINS